MEIPKLPGCRRFDSAPTENILLAISYFFFFPGGRVCHIIELVKWGRRGGERRDSLCMRQFKSILEEIKKDVYRSIIINNKSLRAVLAFYLIYSYIY